MIRSAFQYRDPMTASAPDRGYKGTVVRVERGAEGGVKPFKPVNPAAHLHPEIRCISPNGQVAEVIPWCRRVTVYPLRGSAGGKGPPSPGAVAEPTGRRPPASPQPHTGGGGGRDGGGGA